MVLSDAIFYNICSLLRDGGVDLNFFENMFFQWMLIQWIWMWIQWMSAGAAPVQVRLVLLHVHLVARRNRQLPAWPVMSSSMSKFGEHGHSVYRISARHPTWILQDSLNFKIIY